MGTFEDILVWHVGLGEMVYRFFFGLKPPLKGV